MMEKFNHVRVFEVYGYVHHICNISIFLKKVIPFLEDFSNISKKVFITLLVNSL